MILRGGILDKFCCSTMLYTSPPHPLYADLSEVRPGAGPRRRRRRPVRVAVLVERVLRPVWKSTSEKYCGGPL